MLKTSLDGFGYTSRCEIDVPPSRRICDGCCQKIGGVHHDRYEAILESQNVLP